jgi:predicted kinase
VAQRRIIDGHGDLRPEHIYLSRQEGEPPAVIDCLEFSAELRRVDILDELAFLEMECDALGAPQVGDVVLRSWLERSGDVYPEWLVCFYKSYRACVRAKVAALRADQLDAAQRAAAQRQAESYLELAESYQCGAGHPLLLAVGGLMGSGKSTLARALAEALGIEHLQTDVLRRELLGEGTETSAYGAGRYAPEAKERVYAEMFRRAAELLRQGLPVVLDGTFLTAALRRRAAETSQQHAAASLLVWCGCPPDVAMERISRRLQQGTDASEARPELYSRQAAEHEPVTNELATLAIDTTTLLDDQLSQVFARLRELQETEGRK